MIICDYTEDGESYLILIVNGCMDIVRIVLEPQLHCFSKKIGKVCCVIVLLCEYYSFT